ncbi:unnamed protein product [Acanthosepion pharaonis]|uniref:Uncharacterized protein n=1 Tax=Acanthosepion pharaonis TaxID=158019 RepID=A0A812B489_ACAPH|nr:unnamed protein product [Sepia pharaonis]
MYLGWKTVSVCAKFTGSLDLANSGIPFYPTPPTHGFSLLLGMLNGDNGECNTRCLIQPKSSLSPAFCSAASHPSELRAHVKVFFAIPFFLFLLFVSLFLFLFLSFFLFLLFVSLFFFFFYFYFFLSFFFFYLFHFSYFYFFLSFFFFYLFHFSYFYFFLSFFLLYYVLYFIFIFLSIFLLFFYLPLIFKCSFRSTCNTCTPSLFLFVFLFPLRT